MEISKVPPSPNRGIMPTNLFNPTNQDFKVMWNGVVQGIVPAGKGILLPEFLARHGAKHLAELIISRKWKVKINKDAVGQITPDTAKATPKIEIQKMMEALLKGSAEAFSEMTATIEGSVMKTEEELKPYSEEEAVAKEEVAKLEKTPEELEAERKALIRANRIAGAARAREVARAKRETAKKLNQ